MDIRRIEYFIKVAETLNFSEAAKQLHISHQALSKQIQILEQEVGSALLERSTSRVSLTEIGKKMYTLYVPIVEQIYQAQMAMQEFIQYKKNNLRVGYFEGLSYPRIVAPLLRYIRSVCPDLTIKVRAMFIDTERKQLLEDKLDMAISVVTNPAEWEKTEHIVLMSDPAEIIVSENHPWYQKDVVTVEDIRQETMIEYDRDSPGIATFMPHIKAGMRMRVSSLGTYMARVDQGDGFAVVGWGYNRREGNYKILPLPKEYQCQIPVVCAFKRLHPMAGILRELKKVELMQE